MSINITTVFNILKQQVKNGKANVLTYSELSQAYYDCTGVYHEPHGSWDAALGKINNWLYTKKAPPISAIVILKGKNEPGGGFWGCSPNVPNRPKTEEEKVTVWMRILEDIGKYDWHNITLS